MVGGIKMKKILQFLGSDSTFKIVVPILIILIIFVFGMVIGNYIFKPSKTNKDQLESKIERLIIVCSPDKKETWQILQTSIDGTLSTSSDFTINEIIQIKKQFDKLMPYTFYLDEKELKVMRDNLIFMYPLEVKK